ncbi:uncharacterized protein LTR77_004544 [Saxophila tyrrhenica]|uniref:Rhodopsin domain-containing protein n=1 Tax=Saxophila tyrrhenica TaxID=1690608 RepID=A0AAV9PG94_9PEZI|nr:hypothetical protein LTR77_004544 [Saxophila tyrrhenica]
MSLSHGSFQGRSEAVLTVTILMLAFCSIFVALRMFSRAVIVKKIAVDDYFIILAWIIAAGLSIAICIGCAWGLGRHEENVPGQWQAMLRKANYVFSVLYQPALMATKTSILAFYLALPTSNRIFKWACIGTLVVVNAGGLALGLFTVFQCWPIGAAFQHPIPQTAHCTDIITIYLSSTPLNIITDLAILFLPMPILTSMRLPKKQKIILIITFSFGAFVAAVDVVRVVYLQGAARTRIRQIAVFREENDSREAEQTDFSWYASLSFMWSAIEVNLGIMCASVPGLKPLVSRFLPSMLRDVGDPTSRVGSVSSGSDPAKMQEVQRVPSMPSLPEDVRARDFSISPRTPTDDEEPMGMIDFLTAPDPRQDSSTDDEGTMGMMDFLTTPETTHLPPATRTQTNQTNTSRNTNPATEQTFFDFVNMKRRKGLPYVTTRESIFPISAVTVLFFIWGFEYGLLDVLNQQFQRVAHMSAAQSTGIHSAYFAGYAFGPPTVGRLVLKHWGFKACFTVGLSIFGCGTLIFWPAAVLTSFSAFIITNFIVAFGLSILEVAANPFIALCGPAEYSEIRLNLSQAVQAVGSIVAPLIADKAFFTRVMHAPSLVDTQWAYLGISLFTILLAVVYYYIPLPEASDEELEDAAERLDGANNAKMGNVNIIWITLAFGVFSQFCYVGAQEANATNYDAYLDVVAPTFNPANTMAVAHTTFAVSRFLAAGLGFWVKPRILMLVFYIGSILFSALAMHYGGDAGVGFMIMVFFFEGPLFALIYAQCLRGMGKHTKLASVFITSAVCGGSVFAPISSVIATSGRGAMFAVVVPAVVLGAGTIFPIYLNASPLARKQCDPIKDATSPEHSRPASDASRTSRALSFLQRNKKRDSPVSEWREQKSNELSPVRHGLA